MFSKQLHNGTSHNTYLLSKPILSLNFSIIGSVPPLNLPPAPNSPPRAPEAVEDIDDDCGICGNDDSVVGFVDDDSDDFVRCMYVSYGS